MQIIYGFSLTFHVLHFTIFHFGAAFFFAVRLWSREEIKVHSTLIISFFALIFPTSFFFSEIHVEVGANRKCELDVELAMVGWGHQNSELTFASSCEFERTMGTENAKIKIRKSVAMNSYIK